MTAQHNTGQKGRERLMKAIKTTYHGPTNTKGSRIIASDEDGNRITIPYPCGLSNVAAHKKAARALCEKMKWVGKMVSGSLKNGYVFVFVDYVVVRYSKTDNLAEQQANAHLISAAPDLLEACKRLLRQYEIAAPHYQNVEAVSVVKIAISKAEGRE